MGKAVTTAQMKGIVDGNVRAYVEQSTKDYARLFARGPVFATYYSQDLLRSSADQNLGGTIEVLGPESPIRFKAIHDMPLYGISDIDVSQAYDEAQGAISGNVGGDAHVLPGTVEPLENDVFVIQHLQTKLVFRVRSVDTDRIEGRPYFRLGYFLDSTSVADLPAQTTGEYQFELANVGTEFSPIIETGASALMAELEQVAENLRLRYWRAFYDRSSGALILRDGFPFALHDRSLDIMVRRGDLLSGDGYLGSRTVANVDYGDRGLFEDAAYPLTLMRAAESGEAPASNFLMLSDARPTSPSSPFYADFAVDGLQEAIPIPADNGTDSVISVGGADFLDRIASKSYDGLSPLRSLAAKCLAGEFAEPDRDKVREFIDLMNDPLLMAARTDAYWLVPVVLLQGVRIRDYTRRTWN